MTELRKAVEALISTYIGAEMQVCSEFCTLYDHDECHDVEAVARVRAAVEAVEVSS